AFVFSGGAMLGDEAVNDGVEAGSGAAGSDDAGDGGMEEVLHGRGGGGGVGEGHGGGELGGDASGVVGDVGVEERTGDDLEREGHHGGGDVDGLPRLPLCGVVSGARDDLVGVCGDALAVEGGGDDAALADVDGVVGGDEAFAEQDLHA